MASLTDGKKLESSSSSPKSGKSAVDSNNESSRNGNDHQSAASAAAHLIKTLDSAFASMNQNAVAAAQNAEEARRNARTASELARLYQHYPSIPKPERYWAMQQSFLKEHGDHRYAASPAKNRLSYLGSNGKHIPFSPYTPASAKPDKHRSKFSPAEDVLSLSLELDRTKEALVEEQAIHEKTKSELEKAQQKVEDFEKQMEGMISQQETERHQYENRVEELEAALEVSNQRVAAAEEDAQVALDLAKTNAESREQVEGWLQQALNEIQTLRSHIASWQQYQQLHSFSGSGHNRPSWLNENGNISASSSLASIAEEDLVNTDDEEEDGNGRIPTATSSSSSARPARALIAAGRQMLQRTQSSMVIVPSPDDVAERRRRLKEHLESISTNHNLDKTLTTLSNKEKLKSSTNNNQLHPLGTSVEAMDVCKRTTKSLKESGKRLKLSGRWWTGQSMQGPDELHLDKMARHYCHEVENLVDQKCKYISELESLCALWESGSSVADKSQGASGP